MAYSRVEMCNLGAAAAGLGAVGSLLPWVTARSVFGEMSVAGTDGDGMITLVTSAVAAVLFYIGRSGTTKSGLVPAVGSSAIGAAVALWNYSNVSDAVADTDGAVDASVGAGLYLTIAGSVVAIIAGVVAIQASTTTDDAAAAKPVGGPQP
jgi:hypothetical protein